MKRLLPFLMFLLFLSCGVPGVRDPAPVQTVEIRLDNHNWSSARLYMIQAGHSRKVGTAAPLSKSMKHVRVYSGGSVRFFVRFLAGYETWLSPELGWVHPGACVLVRVEAYLNQSSAYPCPFRNRR